MPPRERCPWLNILIFVAASVQITLLVTHVLSTREIPDERRRVAGLSDAEIELVQMLRTEEERVAAVETLRIRALGPVARVKVAGTVGAVLINRSIETYGGEVVIDGLESCKKFRETTSPLRRMGVAGLFNTGTNYFDQVFRRNCVMPRLCRPGLRSTDCAGHPWQVVWGKHNPPSWRYTDHAANTLKHFNRTDMMPVVMIKDPLTWMRSMCVRPYAARFPRSSRCPSPLQKKSGQAVNVVYRKDAVVRYESLLDMWSTWYQAYASQRDPRLIVRYEDVLFRTEETIRRVCDCVGGSFSAVPGKQFDFVERAAKGGKGHGSHDQTDRAGALKKYGSKDYRYEGLTAEDVRFYVQNSPSLVSLFHYQADERLKG